jgi:hypothetical protein
LWYQRDHALVCAGLDAGLSRTAFYAEAQVAWLPRHQNAMGFGLSLGPRRSRDAVPRTGLQTTAWLLSPWDFPGMPYVRFETDRQQAIASAGLMLKLPVSWQALADGAPDPRSQYAKPPAPGLRVALRPFLGVRGRRALVTVGGDLAMGAQLKAPLALGAVAGITDRTQSLAAEIIYQGEAGGPRVALDLGAIHRHTPPAPLGLEATLWWMSAVQDFSPLFPYLRCEGYRDGPVMSGGLMARIGR